MTFRQKLKRAEEETVNSGRQLLTAEGEAKPADEAVHRGLHIEKVDCRCDRLSVKVVCYEIEYLLYLCSALWFRGHLE